SSEGNALTRTLIGLDFSSVRDLFEQHETCSPSVLWNPSIFDIPHPIITEFANFMHSGRVDARALGTGEIFEGEKHAFEPWFMALEPLSDGSDFKYLQYGSEIAAMFGRDLTGGCTSEIGGHISDFFIALYAAVLVRKQSVLSVHVPPTGVFATVWRRLIFPVLDETGEVRMIAAVNVADNELRAGLEALPDPALVAGEDGTLMYANAAARRLFGDPTLPRGSISDYCEMDIELPEDAEVFAKAQSSMISKLVGSRNQVLVHFELRTSATFFRGTPYFVVQLKPY
ncbi:MAG: PAS domain-containing protein, partial [Pseudomonadota bacterium]